MKLGLFMMPVHPLGKNYVQSLREDRETALLADEVGFDEAFFGEHTTDLCETIPSSLAFIASLAYATKRIKLGTGTLNLSISHPANIAATVSMVDHMLEGRFIMGISPGGLPSDWEIYENFTKDRTQMFVECINHILALWELDAPFDISGTFWNLRTGKFFDRRVGTGDVLRPFQKPRPEIACTALHPNSPGLEAAAARGWNPISANILQETSIRNHWQQHVRGCETGGRAPDTNDWRVCRNIFVADDDATAKRYGKGKEGPYYFYVDQLNYKLRKAGRLNTFKYNQEDSDESISTDYLMDRLVIAGTVNEVVDSILAFHEAVGDFGTLLYAIVDWFDASLARRSMELLATRVMPAVNKALALRQPAPAVTV